MDRRGFAFSVIVMISAIFLVMGVGGVAYCVIKSSQPTNPIVCTQEAKLCPDGSYVGCTGPNCEFASCPSAGRSCKKDSECPSPQYICQEIQGVSTACPSTDPSCVTTHTVIRGECKLKEGNRCGVDSDCTSGNLCHKNICTSPIGRQCNGPNDTGCPTDFECIQGCGPPVVRYPNNTPPSYFCQLKGYIRPCPICLASNTNIDTPGGEINVRNIKAGTKVWSLNKGGQKIISTIVEVSRTLVPDNHSVIHLVLVDHREVWVSTGHPTADGRIVGNLSVGNYYDGAKIISADLVPYWDHYTYDLLPDSDTGYYWANDVLLGSTLFRH